MQGGVRERFRLRRDGAAAVGSSIAIAKANGADVFFDPGPRAFTFVKNDSERREALDLILGAADVILATLDEAAALVGGEEEGGGGESAADGALESSTAVGASYSEAEGYGKMDPLSAATALFRRPGCVAEWVVIKGAARTALRFSRGAGTRCTSGARGSRSGTPSGAGTRRRRRWCSGRGDQKGEEEALPTRRAEKSRTCPTRSLRG